MEKPLDNSRLIIKLIKSKPSLWNPKNLNYSHRQINDDLWCELAKAVNVTAIDLRAKWNTLRNSYARSIRADNIDPIKPRAKWYLEDEMSFLQEYVKHRNKRKHKKRLKKEVNNSKKLKNELINKDDDDIIIINKPIIDNSISIASSTTSSLYINNNDQQNESENANYTSELITKPILDEYNSNLGGQDHQSKSDEINENVNRYLQLQSQDEYEPQLQHQPNSDSLFFQSIEMDFIKLPMKKKRKFKTATMILINELLDETDEENGSFDTKFN